MPTRPLPTPSPRVTPPHGTAPTRTHRFAHGMAAGLFRQMVTLSVGFVFTPFLLRHLGASQYGAWLVALQGLGYLSLAELGVVALLPREAAYATARGRKDRGDASALARLVGEVMTLTLVQTLLLAVAPVLVWFFPPKALGELREPLAALLAAFAVLFPTRVFPAVLEGVQDLGFHGGLQTFAWLLGTGITAVMVYAGRGFHAMVWGWIATQAALAIGCAIRIQARHGGLGLVRPRLVSRERARGYLGSSAWLGLSQLVQVVLTATDIALIGRLLGAGPVVPYAMTGKLVSALGTKPQLIMHVAMPGLSELKAGESPERVRPVITVLSLVTLVASGAIAVVVLAINRAFVAKWVGPDLFAGGALTACLVASMMARHWSTTLVYSVFCFGHTRNITLIGLAESAVSLAVSWLLIQRLGVIGAPLGSLVGVLVVAIPALLIALSGELRIPIGALVAPLAGWGTRLAGVIGAVLLARHSLHAASWPGLVLLAAAVGTAYAAVMLPVLLRPPAREFVLRAWGTVAGATGLSRPS